MKEIFSISAPCVDGRLHGHDVGGGGCVGGTFCWPNIRQGDVGAFFFGPTLGKPVLELLLGSTLRKRVLKQCQVTMTGITRAKTIHCLGVTANIVMSQCLRARSTTQNIHTHQRHPHEGEDPCKPQGTASSSP